MNQVAKASAKKSPGTLRLSIVIPSYNEATYINRLLDALTKQNFQDYEVIVSDAKSNDDTLAVVRSFSQRLHQLKTVVTPPRGPAAGRNAGAAEAKGEWLLFLDADDDIDDPNFLEIILTEAQQRGWQTATTNMKAATASSLDQFGLSVHHAYLRLLAHTKHPVAPGFCILTRRSLFEANHGFDERLWNAEDYDYVSRTAKSGFGFVEETYYYVDLRRFQEGGKIRVFLQAVGYEAYRFTHHYRIDKDPFHYKFGQHQKRLP